MSFVDIAARLRTAAESLQEWAPIADDVADGQPEAVPAVTVDGASRPVEALVIAREAAGYTTHLDRLRAAAIQAVLHAEGAIMYAQKASRNV